MLFRSSAKVQVIAYLFEHQDKVIYQKDLEHVMNLSRPTINGIVKRLIAKGAVKLIPNPNDRRSKQLILSDTAKEEAQKHQKEFENDIRTIEKNLPLVYQPTRLKNSNIGAEKLIKLLLLVL